ncbi:MAG: undecaprenyl-phosphate glucose phosphotransferase [Hyphomicrobiales bacterium]|nr:undecaprenyl-phosphate glucose phosphotransferase [Hyphomicrobiales bacterium]
MRRWASLSRAVFFSAALACDVIVICALAWATGVAYHGLAHQQASDLLIYLEVGALSAMIFVIPNLFNGEYRLASFFELRPHWARAIRLWNVTFICLLALAFMAQVTAAYSRGWAVVYYLTTAAALLGLRYAFYRATALGSRHGLIYAQRIFLFGTAKHIEDFVTRYRPRNYGISIVGCHFVTPAAPDATEPSERELLARDLDAAVASARALEPDAVFLVMPWSDTRTIDQCADALLKLPAEIHLGAEPVLDRFEHVSLSRLGAMASLQLTRLPLSRIERIEKRALDLALASLALILLTPALLVVAALIKLDSAGPVFFLQRRHGFNQKPFRIIKFRTMRTLEDGPSIRQACAGDPRITRVGAWLRRWNIDELPQLFNVIMGDMSLVGPRPHALSHDREFEQRVSLYARRHNVKPGITGWAQVHGFRGETDTDDKIRHRVEHDLFYIDNWSLALDLQILLRTLVSPRSYRNAY